MQKISAVSPGQACQLSPGEWQDSCNEKETMKFAMEDKPMTGVRNYDGVAKCQSFGNSAFFGISQYAI